MNQEQLEFMQEREYITFFKSYRNIYEKLNDEQKLKFINAIFSYSFDGVEFEDLILDDAIVSIVFDGVLPNLKNNRVKYLNGKLSSKSDKNGRPKKAKKRLTKGCEKADKRLWKGNKNINKNINKEEEIYNLYIEFKTDDCKKVTALKNIKMRLKTYSMDDLIETVNNYRSTLKDTELKYITIPQNFFGQKAVYLDYLPENFNSGPKPLHDHPKVARAMEQLEEARAEGMESKIQYFEDGLKATKERYNVK